MRKVAEYTVLDSEAEIFDGDLLKRSTRGCSPRQNSSFFNYDNFMPQSERFFHKMNVTLSEVLV
jgi:hypothetical protein